MSYLYCLLGFLFLNSCQQTQSIQIKKNVLFILADDFGYHDMSGTGSKYYSTPNIDRIASEGVAFSNGYATCRVCSPSRVSIMSGKFPARHGVTDWIGAKTGVDWRKAGRYNQLLPPAYEPHLSHEYVTLPEAMQEAGYKTFFAGKWHMGDKGSWPEDHGFNINIGGYDRGGPVGGYFSPFKNPKLTDGADGENLSMRLAKETSSFIEENKDKPFFAFLSFYAVHSPIETTKEKWLKYRNKAEQMGIAEEGFKMGHFLPIRQHQDNPVYAGLVESMDDAVGEVLKSLDRLGLADNTIVVFTSDNGGVAAGDNYSTSNLPLRGGKGYQYEGGIREPYFIKVPGIKGGKKVDVPVTGTDFYPTLLELIGVKQKPEEHLDGVSLVPLLKGKSIKQRELIWHYPHYGNQGGEPSSIIRDGDWKLIHYYEDEREELYNLKTDISERADVSELYPDIKINLHNKLFNYLNDVGAKFPEKDPEYDAEKEKEYLKSIATNKKQALDKQRKEYLSKEFNPDNNWWGSEQTID
ncbi:sulfatase [Marinilabilia rubra]|uniref:Sulfatase n=2 Tax=Marinilabilia rubra TaxID=2162893 RepID=A0A2U2B909_9BACT|nr:sulfatase [Marinilabilia rubra]